MNTGLKLAAYGLVLVGMLAGGAVVGAAAGPIDVGGSSHDASHSADASDATVQTVGGLLVSQDGYTFEPEDRLADAGEFAFTIVGPEGHAVESYDLRHGRELHLIIASRDLRTFRHLHPTRGERGRWTIELPALPAGSYRAFADFQPSGAAPLTLGVDLVSPGSIGPIEPLLPRTLDTVDGLDATLDLDAGAGMVTITVRRGNDVITTEPYLGAAGHLVALRDGDLAYLHVHPLDAVPVGPVRFGVEFPSAGTYALFFDFQVDGRVHTASFVLDAARLAASHGAHG